MSYELKACPCGAPAQERENSPSPEKLIECTECSFAAFITDWQNRADLTSEGLDGLIEECIKYIKSERLPCCFGVDEKEIVVDVVRYIVKQSSHY